jgi:hypothetical protein
MGRRRGHGDVAESRRRDRRHLLLALHQHQPQVLLTAVLFALLTLAGSACNAASSSAPSCPAGDPLRGIYSPKRLTVLKTCRTFAGTVVETDHKDDGDIHVLLTPDPGFTSFLNVENVNAGGMVVEIVPGQQIPEPAVGAHLSLLGTWVLDEHNGWNEIHPVWAVTDLTTGITTQALPPASPAYGGDSKD